MELVYLHFLDIERETGLRGPLASALEFLSTSSKILQLVSLEKTRMEDLTCKGEAVLRFLIKEEPLLGLGSGA